MAGSENWNFDFASVATSGYYVAIRVGFAFPMEERNTFPVPWVDHYTQNGLMLYDPVMKWVYAQTGTRRWSEIDIEDPAGVLPRAARHGLGFGVAISHSGDGNQRSYGNFSRPDREFTDAEIGLLRAELVALHDSLEVPQLTRAELEALSQIRAGLRIKEAAFELGISESAVKQRLKGAKSKLGAQTNTHAVSLASELRLF